MIYIVEDDENIGQMECYALKNSGFGTELFEDSESFFSAVARRLPTLVILDLMLPGEDGLTILRRLRDSAETRKIPIIIVSAKSGEADAVRGLDSGADDYITKPFELEELYARISVQLRKTSQQAPSKCEKYKDLVLSKQKHTVMVKEYDLNLTRQEFKILELLLSKPDKVFSKQNLYESIWQEPFFQSKKYMIMLGMIIILGKIKRSMSTLAIFVQKSSNILMMST